MFLRATSVTCEANSGAFPGVFASHLCLRNSVISLFVRRKKSLLSKILLFANSAIFVSLMKSPRRLLQECHLAVRPKDRETEALTG